MKTVAEYKVDGVPERFRGNPLIEALPALVSNENRIQSMIRPPRIDLARSRQQPAYMRVHDVDVLDELFLPPPALLSFASAVDRLVRQSYARRNPFTRDDAERLHNVEGAFLKTSSNSTAMDGMLFLSGLSGMGKSRLCRAVLQSIPQAIQHREYQGRAFNCTQVSWISVDAPIGESVKGLLLRMLEEMDKATGMVGTPSALTPQHLKSSVDKLIFAFGQAALTHRLGLLHIDDLQRVAESSKGKQLALQLIIQLANVVRCPVIFSGTPRAIAMLEESFEAARRVCSGGAFLLDLPKSADDRFFVRLTQTVLKYQWLDVPLVVDDKTLKKLFDLSCGITSVLLFLCKQAQIQALDRGSAALEISDFVDAYDLCLRPLHKALRGLRRSKSRAAIDEYEEAVKKWNDGHQGETSD